MSFPVSDSDSAPRSSASLVDHHWRRRLGLLWLGQLVSHLGDALFFSVMFFVALDVTQSPSQAGLLVAINFLPALGLGLIAGTFVDHNDRRKIMLWADLLRAASVGVIPILHMIGALTPAALGAAIFLLATGSTLFNPAQKAYIPQITPLPHLSAAASSFQVAEYGGLVAGPLLASILIPRVGSVHILAIDAMTFLFSAGCIALLPRLCGPRPAVPNTRPVDPRVGAPSPRAVFGAALSGVRRVLTIPEVRDLVIIGTLNNLAIMGLAHVATPLMVTRTLGLDAAAYSQTLGLFFLGMTLASASFWLFGHRLPKGPTILTGIVLDGLTFIPFAFCTTLGQLGAAQFFHALFIPLIIIPRTVLIQRRVPSALHGRAFALINVTVFGMMAISSGLVGILAESIALERLFLVLGVLGALPGLAGFALPSLRRAR